MKDLMTFLSNLVARIQVALVARAKSLPARTLALGGLGLAAVVLLSVNLISGVILRGWKVDLTEDHLYTISTGTHAVLRAIDEPIKVRLYYTRRLGELAPSYARYFDRIRTMLEQFRDISGGKLELQFVEPEPFSDAEDRAVAGGLTGRTVNAEGEKAYFGLTANNSTDNQAAIPFFSPDRESFVEYDITKLIYGLANPKKRVVGLMTALPLEGGKAPMGEQQLPPWLIMEQIREFFEVASVAQDAKTIPANIDVLMVAQPTELTPEAAYAIDQFALKGGKVLAFIDPMAEQSQFQLMQKTGQGREELIKLLKAWGVGFDLTKVAADISHARRVQFRGRGGDQGMVTEFIAWLGLDASNIDKSDVLSNGITNLNIASAGILVPVDGRTTKVTPLISTSANAMEIPATKVGMGADPVGLLRSYQSGGKPLILAARVGGEAQSAFPNGAPANSAETKTPEEAAKAQDAAKAAPAADHVAKGNINAIVIADTDFMADQFWVENRKMLGQELIVPSANNAALVVGALENLTGSDALIALRGRGIKERQFTYVEALRRDAERKFREKEQVLTDKLKSVEQELVTLDASGGGGGAILSDAERQAVEKAKAVMLSTRRELRDVKLALRQSIDSLDGWLKFANIALVPLMLAAGSIGFAVWRRRQAATNSLN